MADVMCDKCLSQNNLVLEKNEKYDIYDFCPDCITDAKVFLTILIDVVKNYSIKKEIEFPANIVRPTDQMLETCKNILMAPGEIECELFTDLELMFPTPFTPFNLQKICFAIIPTTMMLIANNQL